MMGLQNSPKKYRAQLFFKLEKQMSYTTRKSEKTLCEAETNILHSFEGKKISCTEKLANPSPIKHRWSVPKNAKFTYSCLQQIRDENQRTSWTFLEHFLHSLMLKYTFYKTGKRFSYFLSRSVVDFWQIQSFRLKQKNPLSSYFLPRLQRAFSFTLRFQKFFIEITMSTNITMFYHIFAISTTK